MSLGQANDTSQGNTRASSRVALPACARQLAPSAWPGAFTCPFWPGFVAPIHGLLLKERTLTQPAAEQPEISLESSLPRAGSVNTPSFGSLWDQPASGSAGHSQSTSGFLGAAGLFRASDTPFTQVLGDLLSSMKEMISQSHNPQYFLGGQGMHHVPTGSKNSGL